VNPVFEPAIQGLKGMCLLVDVHKGARPLGRSYNTA